ncbi:meprin A subunit beta-like isoform X3 [Eleginops maclovinus]|uniref:meprin A subunit beta-like isoform X3 n=1 Tax=Eleginops maclovinus TaxID=56733 RepID=UPI0030806F26
MKGYIFLVVTLIVLLSFSQKTVGTEIVDIGESKSIEEANKGFWEDDILKPPPNTQRSAITDGDKLWTSPVPYVLDKDLEMNAKGLVLKAFDQFRLKSCFDFKPRDSEEYYISVKKLSGCFSYIGKVISNGQNLSIGANCDSIAVVEHEFLHALGFYHEQSRYDRDDYVTIVSENIQEGREHNFDKESNETTTTQGVPYDYWSVMHYGKDAFTNGNGSTIITKDPKFQDVIGQRLEVSPKDVLELNLLYKCNSTIAFQMQCSFSDETMCEMTSCSQSGLAWEMVTKVTGGPMSDHTNLPSGSGEQGEDAGYFMHVSTASGQEGDSAWLETHRMSLNREHHVQCLQFYYYHSGNMSDHLNIWIREFQDELDLKGTLRLMGQITGGPTKHWKLHHVSLNATEHFTVEFEARKGAGSSAGGFSIDDINLSEIECPHVTIQLDDFEPLLNSSRIGTFIYSPRQYSSGGYAYRVAVALNNSHFGLFVQLVSGENDERLEWPCTERQVTFKMLDQNSNTQLQMSKQLSITTDRRILTDGNYLWGNPRQFGSSYVDDTGETIFTGTLFGRSSFANENELKTREFLKGGSVIFTFSFQDITPLVNGSALPSPEVVPAEIKYPPKDLNRGSCASSTSTPKPHQTTNESSFITHDPMMETTDYSNSTSDPQMTTDYNTTTLPPPKTTNESSFITHDPMMETTDYSNTTDNAPRTTNDSFTTLPTPKTTNESSNSTSDPQMTTDYNNTTDNAPRTTNDSFTTLPTPKTTNESSNSTSDPQMTTDYNFTTLPPPKTTNESSFITHDPMMETTDYSNSTSDPQMTTDYNTTTLPPPKTTNESSFITHDPLMETTDYSNTTDNAPRTTNDSFITHDPMMETTDYSNSTSDPQMTTDYNTTTLPPPKTTNESSFITHDPMMETTDYSNTTDNAPRTTNDSTTTLPTPKTTNESSNSTSDPQMTTDYNTTTLPPPKTTNESSFITHDPMMETTDYSNTTDNAPRTTNDSTTTLPTPKTTNESSNSTSDPQMTTDYNFTTLPTPKTTNESSFITHDPPETTDYSTTTSDPQMTTDYSTTPLRANKNHG